MDLRGITRPIGAGVLTVATLYHGVEPKQPEASKTETPYCVSVHPEEIAAHSHGENAVPKGWETREAVMRLMTSGAQYVHVQGSGGVAVG